MCCRFHDFHCCVVYQNKKQPRECVIICTMQSRPHHIRCSRLYLFDYRDIIAFFISGNHSVAYKIRTLERCKANRTYLIKFRIVTQNITFPAMTHRHFLNKCFIRIRCCTSVLSCNCVSSEKSFFPQKQVRCV